MLDFELWAQHLRNEHFTDWESSVAAYSVAIWLRVCWEAWCILTESPDPFSCFVPSVCFSPIFPIFLRHTDPAHICKVHLQDSHVLRPLEWDWKHFSSWVDAAHFESHKRSRTISAGSSFVDSLSLVSKSSFPSFPIWMTLLLLHSLPPPPPSSFVSVPSSNI